MTPIRRPYQIRQALICVNQRDPATGKPSCGMNGSAQLREKVKIALKERGLKGTYIATTTGCMDVCPAQGCVVAFYPEGEFTICETEDVDAVLERLLRA